MYKTVTAVMSQSQHLWASPIWRGALSSAFRKNTTQTQLYVYECSTQVHMHMQHCI